MAVNHFFDGFEKRSGMRQEDPVHQIVPSVDGYGLGYGYPEKEEDVEADKAKSRMDTIRPSPIDSIQSAASV